MEKSASREIQQEASSSIKNVAEGTEIQEESRTSSGNENQNERCLIFKVPYHLRKWNKEAYTPHVISIGPYHHNKKKFQTMEEHKESYFRHFMERAWAARGGINDMEDLVISTIREKERRIRRCYVETVLLESDDFVRMIKLDACFILELFLRTFERSREIDDPMLVEGWLRHRVWNELLLLENQVPFFVIEELYHLSLPSISNSLSVIQLTFVFFASLNIHKKPPDVKIDHFTDLLRFFHLPDRVPVRRKLREGVTFPRYSATQLQEAGVKFKVVFKSEESRQRKIKSKSVLDLNFRNGVLEIPLLDFQDSTEARIRNIMALEQCDKRKRLYFTDFFLILDRLINTTKDVDLLSDKGIIVNNLGDSRVVTSTINKLNRGIIRCDMNKNFCDLCEALNVFYENRWHRWKVLLRHQYFSSPWRSASSIAAFILLVLTLVQTIFSIISE